MANFDSERDRLFKGPRPYAGKPKQTYVTNVHPRAADIDAVLRLIGLDITAIYSLLAAGPTDILFADLQALELAGTLEPLKYYFVTDRDILVQALSEDEVSQTAWFWNDVLEVYNYIEWDFSDDGFITLRRDSNRNEVRVTRLYANDSGTNCIEDFPWNSAGEFSENLIVNCNLANLAPTTMTNCYFSNSLINITSGQLSNLVVKDAQQFVMSLKVSDVVSCNTITNNCDFSMITDSDATLNFSNNDLNAVTFDFTGGATILYNKIEKSTFDVVAEPLALNIIIQNNKILNDAVFLAENLQVSVQITDCIIEYADLLLNGDTSASINATAIRYASVTIQDNSAPKYMNIWESGAIEIAGDHDLSGGLNINDGVSDLIGVITLSDPLQYDSGTETLLTLGVDPKLSYSGKIFFIGASTDSMNPTLISKVADTSTLLPQMKQQFKMGGTGTTEYITFTFSGIGVAGFVTPSAADINLYSADNSSTLGASSVDFITDSSTDCLVLTNAIQM